MNRAPTEVSFTYTPRKAFIPFHNRRERFALLACHRRSGKTIACVNDLLIGALEEQLYRPQLAYIAPTYAQAKRVAWEYLKDYARPFLAEPPNEAELRVTLKNNGRIFLAGSDNYDALRGLYLDGAVIDEAASGRPAVWTQVILPALADREGWAVIASTPKGKNHFYRMWGMAQQNPEWYRLLLDAETSGILPVEELERLRREMPPDEFAQEMMVDFSAQSKGAILFADIEQADREGRIVDTPLYDPTAEVYAAADIGFRDTAAWWIVQKAVGGVSVIGYLEDSGLDASDWIEVLRTLPYQLNEIWLPHDARARTFQTRETALETFLKTGWRCRIVPKTSIMDRVNAARRVAKYCTFHGPSCTGGLNALREWTYEWNNENKEYSRTPKHNWASHGGDSFSYMAQMIGNHTDGLKKPTPKQNNEPAAAPAHYAFHLEQLFEAHAQDAQRDRW